MTDKQRIYICIDMTTFYASVECAERGLNPFKTNLAVTDKARGKNAICLAISPLLKKHGIKNRCRVSEIPKNIEYIAALPRMQMYIDYAADIYSIYLDYFSPEDIHVYSIDEAFIDVTEYLTMYKTDAVSLTRALIRKIAEKKRIPATAGIGTNLYLAKVALDITAKHSPSHIGYLDEDMYKKTLWDHMPITDFWQVARGTANRLAKYGIFTMREVSAAPPELLYKSFGINAELLIDHANGKESCLMEDIKRYKSKTRSISFSQILSRDYSYDEAHLVFFEMLANGCSELIKQNLLTERIDIVIGYSKNAEKPTAAGIRFSSATQLYGTMRPYAERLFGKSVSRKTPIRRIALSFGGVYSENDQTKYYGFFSDSEKDEREKSREKAMLKIKDLYGKNAVMRGSSLISYATQRERNQMIGGHRAGDGEG